MFQTAEPTAARPTYSCPAGMHIQAPFSETHAEILTPKALQFLFELHVRFNQRRKDLLLERVRKQEELNDGVYPHFLPLTKAIRESKWLIAPIPDDLQDRRVEITGPVDRKMIINALNSGAKVFMADFEDSNSPSWKNNIDGQINLRDAINKTISFKAPDNGKEYRLAEKIATLMVRPRGWHLLEKHIIINEEPISGGLMDFGLYLFHNARQLIQNGSGPYFYLPKLESYKEARLWNDVFVFAQTYLGINHGTIKATVLIETILAPFQLHEILWELRDHSAGLNCGRWDYIFSFIKKFRNVPGFIFPDRSQVTMTVPFMRAYTQLVIRTCHERGAHAMGGMAAQIPIKGNEAANNAALEKVRADKLREVQDGHDGTWVAHPGLVPIAMEIFNEHMKTPNQIERKREDVQVTENDLLEPPKGTITEEGLRMNINVGILYIESWLRGNGAAAIYNLMEDAATAEISRTQVWQWLQNKASLNDGRVITPALYQTIRDEEIVKIKEYVGSQAFEEGRFEEAVAIFDRLVLQKEFEEFLTLPAYNFID
jgi:malate synthase